MKLTTRIAFLFALVLCALMTVGNGATHLQSLRVRIGDRLSVHIAGVTPVGAPAVTSNLAGTAPTVAQTSPTEPTFQVLSDGTIESHDFGSIHVVGLTIPEVAKRLHDRLALKFKNPVVTVVLASEAPFFVFLSGVKDDSGIVNLLPGEDLRRLLTTMPLLETPDISEAHLFRAGRPEVTVNVQDILQGTSP